MQGESHTLGFGAAPADVPRGRMLFSNGEILTGDYEVRRLLGEGGMGQVFEAHDLVLNRPVAIKVYWPTEDGPAASLLRREAQALAAIQHPGLATVFTMGRQGPLEFLVMERIRGVPLDELMRQRQQLGQLVPLGEAIRILLAIADVLSAVHSSGCLHRDVKPGNVMLAARDRVVLMDFGLFLPEGELTGRTLLAGSPGYMAPESILDRVLPGAGHLVDLYALGVIAFELLSGRRPYHARSLDEMLDQHLHGAPPDLTELVPNMPPRLAALVRELMSKEPYDRPESEEVVWRLRAIHHAVTASLRR